MAAVVSVQDEDYFKQYREAATDATVACVLIRAPWGPGSAFGRDDLEALAVIVNQAKDAAPVLFLDVDMSTEGGEEAALGLNVGSKFPVVRLYMGKSLGHSSEYIGTQCDIVAIQSQISKMHSSSKAVTAAAEGADIHDAVRAAYASTVNGGDRLFLADVGDPSKRRELLGYKEGDVTESADLGLGCGNPLITANLQPGEVVVDLGSGAGMDCFIAGRAVGENGRVVGVDMTPDMIAKARKTATKDGVQNVSFRLGEIEHLPIGDCVANCVISNCVINLSPEKDQVYREMNRVLMPGGRVSISDVLRINDIPQELKTMQSYSCWVAGASADDEMRAMLTAAGFVDIKIQVKENASEFIKDWMPGSGAEKYVSSAYVTASKPHNAWGFRDDVRRGAAQVVSAPSVGLSGEGQAAVGCWG